MAKLQNAEKLTGGNYFPDVFSLAFSAFVFWDLVCLDPWGMLGLIVSAFLT